MKLLQKTETHARLFLAVDMHEHGDDAGVLRCGAYLDITASTNLSQYKPNAIYPGPRKAKQLQWVSAGAGNKTGTLPGKAEPSERLVAPSI